MIHSIPTATTRRLNPYICFFFVVLYTIFFCSFYFQCSHLSCIQSCVSRSWCIENSSSAGEKKCKLTQFLNSQGAVKDVQMYCIALHLMCFQFPNFPCTVSKQPTRRCQRRPNILYCSAPRVFPISKFPVTSMERARAWPVALDQCHVVDLHERIVESPCRACGTHVYAHLTTLSTSLTYWAHM